MLERYLEEVRRELARRLPEDDVQLRLAEVDGHLRDGIEGRLELGLDAESAERETLTAFGTAKQVAAGMAEGPVTASLRGRLLWLGLGNGVFLSFLLFGWRLSEWLPSVFTWFLSGILLSAVGFSVAAFRARRPAPLSFIGFSVLSAVVGCVVYGTTWMNLYAFQGTGLVPPGEADHFLAIQRQVLAEHEEDRERFENGWAILQGPVGIEGLRRAGGYLAPVVQPVSYVERPQYTVLASAQQAKRAWEDLSHRGRSLMDTGLAKMNVDAILEARANPWRNFASVIPDCVQAGAVQAGVVCPLDFTFGGLGLAAYAYRRKGKGRGGLLV